MLQIESELVCFIVEQGKHKIPLCCSITYIPSGTTSIFYQLLRDALHAPSLVGYSLVYVHQLTNNIDEQEYCIPSFTVYMLDFPKFSE